MSSQPSLAEKIARVQRIRALMTKLDLALGDARLASHFLRTGERTIAAQQKAHRRHQECLMEWTALGLDGKADDLLLEKKKAVASALRVR